MTTEEVSTLINEAKNIDWFNSRNIRFYNLKTQFDMTLKGFSAIYEYTVQQSKGWEAKGDNLPQELKNQRGKIQSLKVQLQSFLKNNYINADVNYLNSQWNNQIESAFNGEYVPYTLSEVDFLIVLNKSYPSYYPSAYLFLLVNGDFRDQISNQNNFMGSLMAYEFLTKESSDILSRKKTEAQSVINTKKDFENYLSSSEQRINDLLKEINIKKNTDAEDIKILLENKTKEFDTWHIETKGAYENFIKESADQIDILEESYSEKLKLEAPSHYWQIRSEKLKAEGKTYMNWMIGMIVLGVVLLFVLLVCTPKDWNWVKLGDVLKVSSGKGLKVNELNGGEYPVYDGNGINGYHNKFNLDEPRLVIGRVGVKCGVMHITKSKSWVTDNALIITPTINNFDKDFFYYKLSYENLNKLSVSTAQPVISGSKIYEYEIALPPLSTQQAIVSKIEELFSELDNGVANLKTAKLQLKTYRQSVLKWAFEGRLTNKNEKDGELPKGWKMKTLEQVCDMKAGSFIKASEIVEIFDESLFSCYGGNGLRGYTKTFTHKGEYSLIGRQGALCGNVHLVNGTFHATEHAVVVTKKEKIDIKWLYYKLTAMRLNQYSSGVAQPGLSVNKLLPIEILVPENTEQQIIIVQEIESRLSVADKMEESITQSLQQAEALRQSILKKAFEGKLV